ncbi:MAG TPA: 16S rRNA (cytosine(1402)-N(4))-methyltransferase RsmH [Bacilli bacterium]
MFHHITVLQNEAVEGLRVEPDGIYVDCTLGGAGHSLAIAARLADGGKLYAIDQDETAILNAQTALAPFRDKVVLIKDNFRNLQAALLRAGAPAVNGIPQVNGILFDLGVSSPQLDEAGRGFSYNQDAELDMRMDLSGELTARKIVNEWPEGELSRILAAYGEEKFARKIARELVKEREKRPIETTGQLAELIKRAIPAAARRSGPHPAKRSFQALRIAVNDELGALAEALEQAVACLAPGGRVAVISFHSLEDRICKQTFAKFVGKCTCPPDFPLCVCNLAGELKLVTKKPILPGERELERNPRARSAKLRIAEKTQMERRA